MGVAYQYEHACEAERNEGNISKEHPVVNLWVLQTQTIHVGHVDSCGYYYVVSLEVVIDSLSQSGIERTI